MDVALRTPIQPELEAELRAQFSQQHTLEDVVRFGLAQTPPLLISAVVVQDEYTHDVVLPHPSGVTLVYDAT